MPAVSRAVDMCDGVQVQREAGRGGGGYTYLLWSLRKWRGGGGGGGGGVKQIGIDGAWWGYGSRRDPVESNQGTLRGWIHILFIYS